MALRELDCPNCGAHLDGLPEGSRIACAYCGTQFLVPMAAPPTPPPAAPLNIQIHTPAAATKVRKRAGWVIAFSALLPLVLMLGIGGFVYHQIQTVTEKAGIGNLPSIPSVIGRATGSERIGWDEVGGHPIPVQIDGAAAIIGRTRDYNRDGLLYVDAYAAEDGRRLWRIEGLSNYGEAYQNVHFVVNGERVAVSDPAGAVHVHDLQSGTRLKTATLRERVKDLCAPPAATPGQGAQAPAEVWVRMADEIDLILDMGSGETREAKRPDWCETTRNEDKRGRSPGRSKKPAGPKGGETKTDWSSVMVEGELAVATGHKKPGTAIPRAAGFEPKSRKIIWEADIPAVDLGSVRPNSGQASTLVDGRVVASYGVGTEDWRITAFDAATGERVWDQGMPGIFAVDRVEWMSGANGFLYIERTGALEVRRLSDGAMTISLGDVTYDEEMR